MKAKKSLGQHFLTSPHALSKIIEAADVSSAPLKPLKVLEIGPGKGILTEKLLEFEHITVIACEKDDRAIPLLSEKFAKEITDKRLVLVHEDILTMNISKYGLIKGDYKLIANIPYYITGEILEKFLEHDHHPSLVVLMVQKEVALRIVARDNKESILSLSVKLFGNPHFIANVPRGAFNPIPNVDSAIIKIDNISTKFFTDHNISTKQAFEVIRTGFLHKRKLLIRNLELKFDKEKIALAWKECGLDQNVRAEDISLEKWKSLIYILSK